ncbi:MAG: hypothetical protein PVF83_19725 [Anaerolineales bacterium]|jgi:hypothetical protein
MRKDIKKSKTNKELILRALTDPEFRKMLTTNPPKILNQDLTVINEQELKFVLTTVRSIEAQIAALADELLCANGPCGIA